MTFLLSGLWHGASWNYVLWGLYHALLLIASRAGTLRTAAPRAARRWLTIPQIAGMFVLTNVGWLLFRETDLRAILHAITLSPLASSALDNETAAYLFLLALVYSMPLWIQSIWVELHRGPAGERAPSPVVERALPRLLLHGLACGLAVAAILVLRSHTSLDFIYFQF